MFQCSKAVCRRVGIAETTEMSSNAMSGGRTLFDDDIDINFF